MNIMFLTLSNILSVDEHGIYTDLVREFAKNNHYVYVVSPVEKRNNKPTELLKDDSDEIHKHVQILKVKTGNIQKTNIIEKGVSTVLLEDQLTSAIKTFFSNIKFDLVVYSTPPITLVKPVEYIKKRDNARTYLMLKDIFPQNAVDIGLMSTTGPKAKLYNFFRKKEKRLYEISDKIGCMSQANVDYILKNNPEIPKEKVALCPNAIEVQDFSFTDDEKIAIRKKYGIPQDKTIFVYGGNLGKPQDIPFIIECIKKSEVVEGVYFLIVGSGTEYGVLADFVEREKPKNLTLMQALPRDDYDKMIAACDVGLIFLDNRFTIPNFPSRLLSYMQAGIPVLACTDPNTDIGKVIVEGGFGWWCESDDALNVVKTLKTICRDVCIKARGKIGKTFLYNNYSVNKIYDNVINDTKVSGE